MTLEPVGGLCNRIRAIEAGLEVASERAQDLRVVWVRNSDCGAAFRCLFQPLVGARVVERGRWANRLLRRVELRTGRHSRAWSHDDIARLLTQRDDLRVLMRERAPFVQSFSRFVPSRAPGFGRFVPIPELQAQINRLTSGFTRSVIGIHIRRGDHIPSARRSPTRAFIDRIEREMADNPDAHFFLATDSVEDAEAIGRLFPGRVIARSGRRERDSRDGMRDAVVDLYCLARTTRIIGSYYSSYSETAAEIGGIPLDVIDTEAGGPFGAQTV